MAAHPAAGGGAILRRFIPWALALYAAWLVPAAHAQPRTIPIAEERVVHSVILGEDRRVFVYTPDMAFGARQPGPYPVLYLLDGDRQLPLVAAQIDFLSKINLSMPPMIVVGIDTNHYDRLRDLTPTHSDRASPDGPLDASATSPTRSSGGGEAFLRFVGEELIPEIDRRYPTAPYRVLAGHSLGGLLTVQALLAHPDMFGAYVAISPSLWWDDAALVRGAGHALAAKRLAGRQLFLSIAGEGGQSLGVLRRFDGLLRSKPGSELGWRYREYPDETHASGPVAAYYDAWKFLFPAWLSPASDTTPQKTQAFYDALSRQYGYHVLPPEGIVNARGYAALSGGRRDDALAFFAMNLTNYPGSANAWDSMGDARSGDPERAAACFAEALRIDPGLEDTRRKLARLGTAASGAGKEKCLSLPR